MASTSPYPNNPWANISGTPNSFVSSLGNNQFFVPSNLTAGEGHTNIPLSSAQAYGGTPYNVAGRPSNPALSQSQIGMGTQGTPGYQGAENPMTGYAFSGTNPTTGKPYTPQALGNDFNASNPQTAYSPGEGGGFNSWKQTALGFAPFLGPVAALGINAAVGAGAAGAAGGAASGAGAAGTAAGVGGTAGALGGGAGTVGATFGAGGTAGAGLGGTAAATGAGAGLTAGAAGLGGVTGAGAGAGAASAAAPIFEQSLGTAGSTAASSGGGLGAAANSVLGSKYLPLAGALGTSLLLGNRKIPQQQYLQNNQALQGQGLAGITAAQNGNITKSQQAQLDIFTKNQTEAAKQLLESSGQGADSTAYLAMKSNIDQAALAMKQGFSDQLFSQSIAELGIADGATNQLIQLELGRQQQTGQALSSFMTAYGLLGGFGGLGK